LTYLRQR